MSEAVLCEHGSITKLTINRPEALNALNSEVLSSLQKYIDEVASDSNAKVLVIAGAGPKAFVAGADISEMQPLDEKGIEDYVELGQKVMRSLECLPIPVVAAVDGFALGGGMELALACDLIIASSKAKFGQPEIKLGIIPGFGGTQRLLQRTSIGMTRKLVYLGEMISAEEAQRAGIVDQVIDADEYEQGLQDALGSLSQQAPCALGAAKKVIRQYADSLLEPGLKNEVQEFCQLFATEDRKEGMTAFLEKRKAEFKGA